MKEFRVSKYNPDNYVGKVYSIDEWTSYSDIGKVFNNKIFTRDDYSIMEDKYISFVRDVLNATEVKQMSILKYENYSNLLWKNKQKLSREGVEIFVRNCLREECWGTLYSRKLAIYVGYDYYLHLISEIDYSLLNSIARANCLFCQCISEN